MRENLLETIHSPQDVKKLPIRELPKLAHDIRRTLIRTMSQTGGHLASNLGVVELTLALHRVFDSPEDKLIWDVGHQSYVHKLLTGRLDRFDSLRQQGGLSGFPKHLESEHDAFIGGHSSTSISAALGFARANRLRGDPHHAIAIIGDGAFTGGLAYEGLNNAGRSPRNRIIVVLNDNEMSISENVGAIARYLSVIRSKPEYFKTKDTIIDFLDAMPVFGAPIKSAMSATKDAVKRSVYQKTFFEEFGFTYMGPVDGHDIRQLIQVFERAKELCRPVFVHVHTIKGKGYTFAEKDPGVYHGISGSGFDIRTGHCPGGGHETFSSAFGEHLCEMAAQDPAVCAVTAAMREGTGLREFSSRFSDRFFDVGIAEEHAVTFSCGFAAGGMRPVFAVYSSFLQRCYDELIHDASIEPQNLLLAIDRAGIVGADGETHQGIFDVAMLRNIPGIRLYAPAHYEDLRLMMEEAHRQDGLRAIRYPRGGEPSLPDTYRDVCLNYTYYLTADADTLLVTYGRELGQVVKASETLSDLGIRTSVLRIGRLAPLDETMIEEACHYRRIFFIEEGIRTCGLGEQFGFLLLQHHFQGRYIHHAIEGFVPQATVDQSLRSLALDADGLVSLVQKEILS